MKILHIIQLNERNTYNLFKQLYEKYDMKNHIFLVINVRESLEAFPKFKEFTDFIFLPNASKYKKALFIRNTIKDADFVIFNSLLFNSPKYLWLFYLLIVQYKKKCCWIEWGGDLYNWYREKKSIRNMGINYVNKSLRKKMDIIGITLECDEYEVRKQFPNCKVIVQTPLPFGTDRIELLTNIMGKKRTQKSKYVQISHNSLSINNHISILAKLERFSRRDIKLVLPLSYGSFGIGGQFGGYLYRDAVISFAKSVFGKKAIIMKRQISIEEYLQYLWGIDIAIFDTKRPIGMANILYLLYMGKKVYLPSNSPQYMFLKEKGVRVYNTYDIPNQTYEEFIENGNSPYANEWVVNKFKPYSDIEKWGELFDLINNMEFGE